MVDGRTIATDRTYFPKGTLAYLEFSKPVFEDEASIEPLSYLPTSRYVIDQDTGGAIRGPGRADLFWGNGPYAEIAAGHLKHTGELYFLVLEPES